MPGDVAEDRVLDAIWKAARKIDDVPRIPNRLASEAWNILIQRLSLGERVTEPALVSALAVAVLEVLALGDEPFVPGLEAASPFEDVPLAAVKRILQFWWSSVKTEAEDKADLHNMVYSRMQNASHRNSRSSVPRSTASPEAHAPRLTTIPKLPGDDAKRARLEALLSEVEALEADEAEEVDDLDGQIEAAQQLLQALKDEKLRNRPQSKGQKTDNMRDLSRKVKSSLVLGSKDVDPCKYVVSPTEELVPTEVTLLDPWKWSKENITKVISGLMERYTKNINGKAIPSMKFELKKCGEEQIPLLVRDGTRDRSPENMAEVTVRLQSLERRRIALFHGKKAADNYDAMCKTTSGNLPNHVRIALLINAGSFQMPSQTTVAGVMGGKDTADE